MSEGHVVKLSELVKTLLEQGYHPRDIRRQLQARGVPFRYKFSNAVEGRRVQVQGEREKARRMRRANLCVTGCGGQRYRTAELCGECLSAKWSADTNRNRVPR